MRIPSVASASGKVVTQPDAARIRVDQDAAAPGGMDAEARARDGLDPHLARLQMEPGIGQNVSCRDPEAGIQSLKSSGIYDDLRARRTSSVKSTRRSRRFVRRPCAPC